MTNCVWTENGQRERRKLSNFLTDFFRVFIRLRVPEFKPRFLANEGNRMLAHVFQRTMYDTFSPKSKGIKMPSALFTNTDLRVLTTKTFFFAGLMVAKTN